MDKIRPPIVTIMGHIDHGKTTLLDKIRLSNVCRKESGGITQHIGAYQSNGITFIDTPGHAAFCCMRERGAQITDIVVLVISGAEGVMPQTKECIKYIKAQNIPVIVALNKCDLDTFNPDKIKGQLVELDLTPEDYGGQIACLPISAKTGQGIDKLMEMIKLNAEIMELKDEDTAPLSALVIESKLDKAKGPVATVIVKTGTLKKGDSLFFQNIPFKVKALLDYNRQNIQSATPSTPVEILGFPQVPLVGSWIKDQVEIEEKNEIVDQVTHQVAKTDDGKKINIVLKADTQGTLEALRNCLSDDVVVLASGIGSVTDNDIFIAQSGQATIYAFNAQTPKFIAKLAENEKVKIFSSNIIYEIIEDIQSRVLKMLEPTIDETILGEGKIIAEFKINKVRIAGVKVTKGEFTVGDSVHLKRDDEIIKDTKVEGIHQGKEVIDKIKMGNECGITFKPYIDFHQNDVIISYKK